MKWLEEMLVGTSISSDLLFMNRKQIHKTIFILVE